MVDTDDQAAIEAWVADMLKEEQFIKDLQGVLDVGKESLVRLAKAWVDDRTQVRRTVESVAEAEDLPVQRVAGSLTAIAAFLIGLPEHVSPERGVAGLVEKQVLPEEKAADLTERLRCVDAETTLREAIRRVDTRGRVVGAAAPRLKGMWTRCINVAQFKPEYASDDDPDLYNPKVEDVVPMVTVQIDVDAFGETERVFFGLQEHELKSLINRLRLAQVQLKTM